MVGLSLALGRTRSTVRALVQGGGKAMRMRASRFAAELAKNGEMRREVNRCLYVAMATAMQIAACNNLHVLTPRLARWLLMVRDRLDLDEFRITHEFLATMLGVRRAGVTGAATDLQRRGMIRYRRGKLEILDVQALRGTACSCYKMIRKLEEEL
jgi:CRP-like cAMP-binding protein